MTKVFLALIDGMRPDGLKACGHPFYSKLLQNGLYTMQMRTVMPSMTLPCHMSLFHSVSSDRHGILTNTYVPQVRPVNGLCEVLAAKGMTTAFFYTWEPLRDLARPLSVTRAFYANGKSCTYNVADKMVADDAERMVRSGFYPDFIFFYQCQADEAGHKYGWMSGEYMQAIRNALDNVQHLTRLLPDDYKVIVTADHGGHNRIHGTDCAEDMTIPFFMLHKSIAPGRFTDDVCITDIAPTVVKMLGTEPDPDWEGKALL